jgi:hypothetical protein
MRALLIIVLAFALLSYDIVDNDGQWSRDVTAWVHNVIRDIRNAV